MQQIDQKQPDQQTISSEDPGAIAASDTGVESPVRGDETHHTRLEFKQEEHYLDLMEKRLEAQVDYVHKKQAILFSLSAGILAVLFYGEQHWVLMIPFLAGLIFALVSIVPIGRVRSHPPTAAKNIFFYGTLADTLAELKAKTKDQYFADYLANLNDLKNIVGHKNRWIAWSALCFFFGVIFVIFFTAVSQVMAG